MDSKFPLLSPFNYADWKPKMSAYLKRQCLFDVSIGALSEPESYEENIDWINSCDIASTSSLVYAATIDVVYSVRTTDTSVEIIDQCYVQ